MRLGLAAALALASLTGCAGGAPTWLPLLSPAPAWERPLPPPADRPIVDPSRLHRSTLENGLQVLVLEDRRLPRVSLGVALPRGAGDLPAETAGLATFSAELMRRGAGDRDAVRFDAAVDDLGAVLVSSAGWDAMSVRAEGLSRDLETLTGLVADVVRRPRLDAAEAERLRSERRAEIQRRRDDPSVLVRQAFAAAVFDGHRYGRPINGDADSVEELTAAAARALHARFWTPSGAIFFVTGDVDVATVTATAGRVFGDWSGPALPPVGPPAPSPTARQVVVVDRPELGQATIVVGHEGFPRNDPGRTAASLMNVVLGGGGFSSRIMSRVREAEGLAYYAYSSFGMRRLGGVFAAATGTRVPEAGRAVGMVLAELERIRSEPPGGEDLAHARSLALGRFALGLETSEAIVSELLDVEIYGLPPDSLDTYRARVRALTTADLGQAARGRVHPERAAIVAVGPAEALVPQLEAYGPVEVVQP